jgi:tRNA threonylcarbamoyladenosine biosynthesis protein TsaB
MKILALETSTMMGSVAIMDQEGLIAEYRLNIKSTHSERLMRTIDEVLKDSGLELKDLDGYAVSIGPGSFTGLRIGISTVKGLAFVTRKPVAAIPTLDALACNIPFSQYQICPMLDARKKEVYTALYSISDDGNLSKRMDDCVIRPEIILKEIKEPTVFLGEGARIYKEMISEGLGQRAHFAPMSKQLPSAVNVAELGLMAFERGAFEEPANLVPKYIRKSEAELKFSSESGVLSHGEGCP